MLRDNMNVVFVVILFFSFFACSKDMDDKLKNSYFAMCYTAEFAESLRAQW
jgi:hypothetical protein